MANEAWSVRPRLLVCLTFPFRGEAMPHLFEVLLALTEIRSIPLDVRVITDCANREDRHRLQELAYQMSLDAVRISVSFHEADADHHLPLSWAHKPILQAAFSAENQDYTHFVYLDDLIRFSSRNLFYFLKYRPILRPYGLIPGFVQVEFSAQMGAIVLPDLPSPVKRQGRGAVDLGHIDFLCLDAPFVPMHVMDADLVREYLASPASDLETSRAMVGWGDDQRSAMGLTFVNPPDNHGRRVAVPVLRTQGTPEQGAWVHHVSNAIALRHTAEPNFPLGRVRLGNMLAESLTQ